MVGLSGSCPGTVLVIVLVDIIIMKTFPGHYQHPVQITTQTTTHSNLKGNISNIETAFALYCDPSTR